MILIIKYFFFRKTQVCQAQQSRLRVAINKARDYGLLTSGVPLRKYDYSMYIPESMKNQLDEDEINENIIDEEEEKEN